MITERQLETIALIQQNLNIEFTGRTKQEATAFISNHLEMSKKAVRESTEEERLLYEEIYYDGGWS